MKKIIGFALLCLVLSAFDDSPVHSNLVVTDAHVTVIKPTHTLRYDFKIKNKGNKPIEPFDYPGHHWLGINLAVRPDGKLAAMMVMQDNTKYRKMRNTGSSGENIRPGKESHFALEYQIKNGVNFDKVKSTAFHSILLILNGPKVIEKIPLNDFVKSK